MSTIGRYSVQNAPGKLSTSVHNYVDTQARAPPAVCTQVGEKCGPTVNNRIRSLLQTTARPTLHNLQTLSDILSTIATARRIL